MLASRQLDALVAEKVMGWRRRVVKLGRQERPEADSHSFLHFWDEEVLMSPDMRRIHSFETQPYNSEGVPHYSTDISEAWGVVENFTYPVIWFDQENANWVCELRTADEEKNDARASSESAPHAICLAALKAVGAL